MLKQEGALAVVFRQLRNKPSKVAAKLETSVIDRFQSFSGNWYESVWLPQLQVLGHLSLSCHFS